MALTTVQGTWAADRSICYNGRACRMGAPRGLHGYAPAQAGGLKNSLDLTNPHMLE